MTLVAQLTDVHLLDRPASGRNTLASGRIAFLSGYRPLSAEKRIERARKALAECRAAKPDHVIVTGDLTEDASKEQWQIAQPGIRKSNQLFVATQATDSAGQLGVLGQLLC